MRVSFVWLVAASLVAVDVPATASVSMLLQKQDAEETEDVAFEPLMEEGFEGTAFGPLMEPEGVSFGPLMEPEGGSYNAFIFGRGYLT